MWRIILSDPLRIIALVGLYPANKLIRRRPLNQRGALRSPAFLLGEYAVLATLSGSYPPLIGASRRIPHPFATRRREQAPPLPFDLHV